MLNIILVKEEASMEGLKVCVKQIISEEKVTEYLCEKLSLFLEKKSNFLNVNNLIIQSGFINICLKNIFSSL